MKKEDNPFYQVELFEKDLAKYCGSDYCVMIDSMTNGLFLVFKYFNFKNEKIVFPLKTYVSPPMMALTTDNIVLFKDYEWEGEYRIEILSRPDIKLYDSAKRLHRNDYIEDAIMIKSFHMKKRITSVSGKGGAIMLNDKKMYDWLIRARWEGREPYTNYKESDIEFPGFNFNPTPEMAVFLRRQLQNLPDDPPDLDEPGGYPILTNYTVFKHCEVIK